MAAALLGRALAAVVFVALTSPLEVQSARVAAPLCEGREDCAEGLGAAERPPGRNYELFGAQDVLADGLAKLALAALPQELVRHLIGYVPLPSLVASTGGRSRAALWQTGTGTPFCVVPGHPDHTVDIKLFPLGDRLATGGSDGAVVIWSVASGQPLHTLRGHAPGAEVLEVEVFPQGDRLVSVGQDAVGIVWDASSGEVLQRLEQGADWAQSHYHVRVFRDGGRLVTGVSYRGESGAIVWSCAGRGQALHRLRQPEGWIRLIELSPDGDTFATAGARSTWLWSATSGRCTRELAGGHGVTAGTWINGIAFVANGSKVVTSSRDWSVVIWDLAAETRSFLRMDADVLGVVALHGGDRVAVFSLEVIVIWNTTSGAMLHRLTGAGRIQRISVSASGAVVAACSSSTVLPREQQGTTVWDSTTGRVLQWLPDVDSDLWPFAGEPRACSVTVGVGDYQVSR